jgi:glycosyltransferase involved in cell wall biosynthesis
LEALATGIPVIASEAGGLPEVVQHGKTGLLYPVGDVEGMASGAVQLLTDRARYEEMSAAAAADARARFSLDTIVSQYETLYHNALNSTD